MDPAWRYESFVARELVVYVDGHYRTLPKRESRAIAGHSMGGHGAMFLSIRHPDQFSVVVCLSGGVDLRPFPDNWDIAKRLGSLKEDPDRWSAETEILLFTAARRDHVEKTIRPALARGAVVICDRFADSTRIFQGITRGDLTGIVDSLHAMMIGLEPDLTLLFDLDPAVGLARATARRGTEMRFEDMGLDFQTRARAGFLALAARLPRMAVIDADRPAEAVAADVSLLVRARLG